MADDAGLDFSDQIGALEIKYQQVYFISISMDVITEFCFYTCCCWRCCSHSLDQSHCALNIMSLKISIQTLTLIFRP